MDLFLKEKDLFLDSLPKEHKGMMEFLNVNFPAISNHAINYGKSQSQFMDNMLTVANPTPIRNLRQINAEVERTKMALQESYYKTRKALVEIKILERDIACESDELKKELLSIELEEKFAGMESGKIYISGAVRKLVNYTEQFQSILASIGVSSVDEVDFEAEEEKYHIMKAFDQALCAARATGGRIDEGNHIYFYHIGINGATAGKEILTFFQKEIEELNKGNDPTHEMTLEFLNKMAKKFKGCSYNYAKYKGQTGEISKLASITKIGEKNG